MFKDYLVEASAATESFGEYMSRTMCDLLLLESSVSEAKYLADVEELTIGVVTEASIKTVIDKMLDAIKKMIKAILELPAKLIEVITKRNKQAAEAKKADSINKKVEPEMSQEEPEKKHAGPVHTPHPRPTKYTMDVHHYRFDICEPLDMDIKEIFFKHGTGRLASAIEKLLGLKPDEVDEVTPRKAEVRKGKFEAIGLEETYAGNINMKAIGERVRDAFFASPEMVTITFDADLDSTALIKVCDKQVSDYRKHVKTITDTLENLADMAIKEAREEGSVAAQEELFILNEIHDLSSAILVVTRHITNSMDIVTKELTEMIYVPLKQWRKDRGVDV